MDLSGVNINNIFVDSLSQPFIIKGDIDNTIGKKQFLIMTLATVSTGIGAIVKQWKHFRIGKNQTVNLSTGALINHPNGNLLRVFAWA